MEKRIVFKQSNIFIKTYKGPVIWAGPLCMWAVKNVADVVHSRYVRWVLYCLEAFLCTGLHLAAAVDAACGLCVG